MVWSLKTKVSPFFVLIGVIILATMATNAIFSKKKDG